MSTRKYWVIFKITEKIDANNVLSQMFCVVGDEEVARQFCKDHGDDFYYLEREQTL